MKTAPQWLYNLQMFWPVFLIGFAIGFACCAAIGLAAHFARERRQRSAFVASLSPAQRERLKGFKTANRDWRTFRDMLP
jgi:hypothetical protein